MKRFLIVVLVLCISTSLTYAGRTYSYVRRVGQDANEYEFTRINDAIADIMQCNLTCENLGCIEVYKGVYTEQLNSFYPGGHNLPEHCDLIGMGTYPDDIVIQHQRRSTSDPNFTNIVSEIYADGVLCDGDNIVSNLKVQNAGENQNSVEFIGEGTLQSCIIVSKHNALTAQKHLVVRNCDIEGKYLPCVQPYSTFEIYDCNVYPKTRTWGGEHPAGIKVRHSGTIDNVTIEANIASSDYEPHYDTPWLAGVILQLRSADETVTINNVRMNLRLTTLYHNDRPNETADWELFGVVSGGRNPEPTTNYPGRGIVKDCQINVAGIEDNSEPNGDGRAIMVAGVCVQDGGRVDVIGNTSIRTDRTAAGFGDEGYEYSLNNQNGIITVDFNTVDFDETITNGVITAYDPNEFNEPNEPNEPSVPILLPIHGVEENKEKPFLNCPKITKPNQASKSIKLFDKVITGGEKDGVIDIDSDITTNTLWTSDNAYHIIADVNVQALLVIEPGTMIGFASGKSMAVNNGGVVISCGTPDNPIVYTSDSGTPGFGDYYCALQIEETASPSCRIAYCGFQFAEVGIKVINNRLDTPIKNNWFIYDVNGIMETGTKHTDLLNNCCFGSYSSGIEIYLSAIPSDEADANSHILIQNNTCDYYQDYGITVHGVSDNNDAGVVVLANNIVSESYQYGLNLVDGYMYAVVTNTGYYDNYANKNWAFDEDNPVQATSMPYLEGRGSYPMCYLDQECPFIDAGMGSVEDMQVVNKTTDVNGWSDCNVSDIGFHYCDWEFSNTGDSNSLPADLDGNMRVNFYDFAIFANYWQQSTSAEADLDGSGFVDFNDLSILCDQWLDTLSLGVTLNQDPNIVSDVLVLTLVGTSDDITCYLFMDGLYFNTFYGDDIAIPTYECRNGSHELKVVGVSIDDEVLVAPTINITVNNRLHCLTGSDAYKYNQTYHFAGFYEPNDGSTIDFTIRDLDEDVIWTNSSSGHFNFVVSSGILQSPYNDLTIEEVEGDKGGDGGGKSGWKSWIKDITKEFDVTSDPNCANARSLLVGVKKGFMGIGDWTYNRRTVWKEYLNACKKKSLDPTICLFFGQATRANIKTAFGLSNVKSVMIISDGNRKVGDTHRTFFMASDGPYFSYLGRNWGGNPNDYEALPDKYEENGYSVCDQKGSFHWRNKMYVFIDACKNGTSCMDPVIYNGICPEPDDNNYSEEEYWKTADMAQAFDIGDPYEQKLYMGWRGFAFKGNPLTHYNNFLHWIWYSVGNTGSWTYKRFDQAISYAATAETGNRIPYQNFSWVGNTAIYFGN